MSRTSCRRRSGCCDVCTGRSCDRPAWPSAGSCGSDGSCRATGTHRDRTVAASRPVVAHAHSDPERAGSAGEARRTPGAAADARGPASSRSSGRCAFPGSRSGCVTRSIKHHEHHGNRIFAICAVEDRWREGHRPAPQRSVASDSRAPHSCASSCPTAGTNIRRVGSYWVRAKRGVNVLRVRRRFGARRHRLGAGTYRFVGTVGVEVLDVRVRYAVTHGVLPHS